jgi:putative transposase
MSTFYDRTSRQPSARAVADAAVAERISAIWEWSRRGYGAPRIHAMLARDGIRVGRERAERLMRQLGIQGAHLDKHWKTTRQDRSAHCGSRSGRAGFHHRCAEHAVGLRT